jgi:L-amino acid N-acyltransferase YncA
MRRAHNAITIRGATPNDASDLARIYNHYIEHAVTTFETDPVPSSEMVQRVRVNEEEQLPWLVAERNGDIAGYAYASKWKGRCAYRYSVETTVYLEKEAVGHGIGRMLYTELLEALRALSLHVAIGGIALPNERSVRLHEAMGFRKVAHFEEVGFKLNRWVDVGYWQRML